MIPMSYYTTNSSNNRLVFTDGNGTHAITLDSGNYTIDTLPPALEGKMNSASANNYNVEYNLHQRTLRITADSDFTLKSFDGGSTAFQTLGLPKHGGGLSGRDVTTSVVDMTNNSPLLLTSRALTSKDVTYAMQENINVLCIIPTNAQPGSFLHYEVPGCWLSCQQELPAIDLMLLNSDTLLPVDLNGRAFHVNLGILTDQDDIPY